MGDYGSNPKMEIDRGTPPGRWRNPAGTVGHLHGFRCPRGRYRELCGPGPLDRYACGRWRRPSWFGVAHAGDRRHVRDAVRGPHGAPLCRSAVAGPCLLGPRGPLRADAHQPADRHGTSLRPAPTPSSLSAEVLDNLYEDVSRNYPPLTSFQRGRCTMKISRQGELGSRKDQEGA